MPENWQIASFVDRTRIGDRPQDLVPGWEPFAVVQMGGQRVVYVRRPAEDSGDRAELPAPPSRQRRSQRAQSGLKS